MNVELTRIAQKKLDQMGATAHGVLVKSQAGAWAAVSEAGRVMWLDGFEGQTATDREDALDCALSGQSHTERLIDSVHAELCSMAYDLMLSHTISGEWPETEVDTNAKHDQLIALAGELRKLKAARAQPEPSSGVPENRQEFWGKLNAFVDEFIEGYEFRGDDGDYAPNERERFLIEDCVAGLLHDMDEEGFLAAAPTPEAGQSGGVPAWAAQEIRAILDDAERYCWPTTACGACNECGEWNPRRDHPEAHGHREDCEAFGEYERRTDWKARLEALLTHPHTNQTEDEWRRTLERIARYPRTRNEELSAPGMREMAREALSNLYPHLQDNTNQPESAGDGWKPHRYHPEIGKPVLGYHRDWIDPDFCGDGIRECFTFGDGTEWQSARWDGYSDQWIVEDGAPEFWRAHPQPPKEGE